MSQQFARRHLLAGGTIAAASAFAAQAAFADDKKVAAADSESLPSLADVIKQLNIPLDDLRPSGILPSAGEPPVFYSPTAGAERVEAADVVAEVIGARDGRGTLLAVGLQWTCITDKINRLMLNASTPLLAKSITFAYSDISWKPGNGWPVYHVRCPRDDYAAGMYYRNAKVHALVHSIGNTYSISCLQSGIFTVDTSAEVRVAVNDGTGDYGDNRGTFSFAITRYTS